MTNLRTYIILNRDLAKCIERRLNSFILKLFKSQRMTQTQYHHLRSTDARATPVYGLPKIHKEGFSMRPIALFINCSSRCLKFVQIFMQIVIV